MGLLNGTFATKDWKLSGTLYPIAIIAATWIYRQTQENEPLTDERQYNSPTLPLP